MKRSKKSYKSLFSAIVSLLVVLSMLLTSGCQSGSGAVTSSATTTAGGSSTSAVTTAPDAPDSTPDTNSEEAKAEQEKFDAFLDDLFLNEISLDTLTLHYTVADPSAYGLENAEPRWEADEEDDRYPAEKILELLNGYNYDLLTDNQKTDYKVLKSYIELTLKFDDDKFEYLSTSFDGNSGIQSAIATNLSEYDFLREKDITDFIALVNLLPDYIDEALEGEKERVEKGYGMVDEVIDLVIEQAEQISKSEGELYLIGVVREKINALDFIDDAKKADYMEQIKTAINDKMVPAFAKIVDTFETFKGKATNEFGLCGFENGKEYYELLAQYASSTSMTCEEMISALEKDSENLISLLRKYYVAELYSAFASGKADIDLTDPNEILDFLRSKIGTDFPEISGDSYEIDYLSDEMEVIMSGVVAYYVTPQVDSYLHGKMKINGANIGTTGYSTLAHEGYPGHMYQHVYWYSTNPSKIRTMLSFLGYTEGWAVYAGNQSYSLYDYKGYSASEATKLVNYNVINERLNWNVSCRIELGIHYEGWTIGELKAYLDTNGYSVTDVESLYYSIVSSPATYLSYYIGYMKLESAKSLAKAMLGSKFSLKEFHKVVLDLGPCPMEMVEEAVDKYISDNK